jgi:hypothetical protein
MQSHGDAMHRAVIAHAAVVSLLALAACSVNSEPQIGHRDDFEQSLDGSTKPRRDAGKSLPRLARHDAGAVRDAAEPVDAGDPDAALEPATVDAGAAPDASDDAGNPYADSYVLSCAGTADDGTAYTYRLSSKVGYYYVECAAHGDHVDLSKMWPQQDATCFIGSVAIDRAGVHAADGTLAVTFSCQCETGPCP